MKLKSVFHPLIKYSNLVFVVLFVGLSLLYNLDETMFYRPQSFHAWRQADCLSITQHYYQDNNSFWEPEIHNQLSDNDLSGKTAGEFPLYYYVVAMFWKLFGKSEFLYRFITLFLAFISLLLVFRFSKEVLQSTVYSFASGLLLMLSPVYVYYAANFLPNIPALSLVIIGWYFIWILYKTDKDKWLWLSLLFFALGFLTKVSSGISFFALGGWLIIGFFQKEYKRVLFRRPAKQIIPFIIVLIAVAAWYVYASWYNNFHDGKYTFNNVWPIWVLSYDEVIKLLVGACNFVKPHFFEASIFYSTAVLWVFLILTSKKRNLILNYLLFVIPFGSFLYFLMWFQAFDFHDYYWIDFFPSYLLVWLLFFYTLKKYSFYNHWFLKISIAALFVFNVIYCQKILKARYEGWPVEVYKNHLQAVGELEPILLELGVGENDKVISIPDESINISLYLMNRKGFCNYNSNFEQAGMIENRIAKGANYLIVNDTLELKKDYIKPFINFPLKTYKNVKVFDLRPLIEN